MAKFLSPAAQAVLDACGCGDPNSQFQLEARVFAAAALRALADHKAPTWDGTGNMPADFWRPTRDTRRELRSIADELEGHHRQLHQALFQIPTNSTVG
jgi:hypothetical protein